jgi:hypothetical protein
MMENESFVKEEFGGFAGVGVRLPGLFYNPVVANPWSFGQGFATTGIYGAH